MNTFNRRDYYRHVLSLAERPLVELRPTGIVEDQPAIVGQAVDLSLGGIALLLPIDLDSTQREQVWVAELDLPGDSGRVALSCTVVHWHPEGDGCVYGFEFHEMEAPSSAESRRLLWRYLLNVPRPEAEPLAPDDDMIDLSGTLQQAEIVTW